ncbi:MAG: cellulase family glycosylhydrolase, partial [Pseudomonadota bacterium]
MKRCVNMGNSLENAVDQGWGGGKNVSLEDFERIKSKGFDTVRIPVRWDDYTGGAPDYTIDPAFAARVQTIVDNALSQDLNVILNIHHFHEIMDAPEAYMPKLKRMWEQISLQFADYPPTLWFETL